MACKEKPQVHEEHQQISHEEPQPTVSKKPQPTPTEVSLETLLEELEEASIDIKEN